MYICSICNKSFDTARSFGGHMSSHNRSEAYARSRETDKSLARKEKRSESTKSCKFCGSTFENGWKLGGHLTFCSKNPKVNLTKKALSESAYRQNMTGDTKKRISDSMKIAHAEDRAWNIGKSRWNNKKSYPEKFFELVILNEFEDRDFINEFPMGKYSLDFAWPKKKKAIEIDGDQHERFVEYKERDSRKDDFAKKEGWEILRIKWKDLYQDSKHWIKVAHSFIH